MDKKICTLLKSDFSFNVVDLKKIVILDKSIKIVFKDDEFNTIMYPNNEDRNIDHSYILSFYDFSANNTDESNDEYMNCSLCAWLKQQELSMWCIAQGGRDCHYEYGNEHCRKLYKKHLQ